MIAIRQADNKDIQALYAIAAKMQAVHEAGYFERCMEEQAAERRLVFIAKDGQGHAVGYAQLNFYPTYAPFRRLNIPEIQDVNVVPHARRQGIGMQLVERCEEHARAKGHGDIGIGVGLNASFGQAQRLYVRRGYVPDGAGVCHDDDPVTAGALYAIDDVLTLKLVKPLAP